MKECVTHHYACDCREAMHKKEIEGLREALSEARKYFELIKDLKLSVTIHEILCDEAIAKIDGVKE